MLSPRTFQAIARAAPTTRPIFARSVPVSRVLSRPFSSTLLVEEPTKAKAKPTKKDPVKPGKKDAVKPGKKVVAKKVTKEKPAKVPAELRPPKGPPSAYILYYVENHIPRLKQGESLTEVGRASGLAWSALPDAEKAVYYELSRVKREEYELAKAQWYKDTDPAIVKQLAKESKDGRSLLKNSPDHIKKPNSSFFLFAWEEGLVGETTVLEHISERGRLWRSFTKEQKKPYIERAEILKAEYDAKIQAQKAAK